MSRIGEAANRPHAEVFSGQVDPARAHQELLRGLDGKQACPFCGAVSEKTSSPCQRCGMDNTPEARKATKARIGPWYVLQARNPAAPGMRFETLLSFVRKGRVRARSVVRGPTTHQLWRFAAHVKGLSREFGLCYSCGSQVEPAANICPQCNRLQEPPINPDVLLEDGEDGSATSAAGRSPLFRELPEPKDKSAAAAAPAAPPEPEDVDIVIPALGAFGPDEIDPKPVAEPPAAAAKPAAAAPPTAGSTWFAASASAARSATQSPRPASTSSSSTAASRPPLGENPFSIAPPPRKKNTGGGETFLSARELAAAFKLSFDPSANMDTVDVPDELPSDALPDGFHLGGALASRPQAGLPVPSAPATVRTRRSRWVAARRVALFLLILAGTGFGAMMWVDPVFRMKTVEWSKTRFAKLHAYATAQDVKSGEPGKSTAASDDNRDPLDGPMPSAASSKAGAGLPASAGSSPEVTPIATPPADEKAAVPSPSRLKPASDLVAKPPRSPVAIKPSVAPAPEPAPQAPVAVAAPPTPAAETPAAPAESSPIPETREAQIVREMQLYKLGVQAENKRPPDYAAAVKAYTEIEKLPAELWHNDVQGRLEKARKKLK